MGGEEGEGVRRRRRGGWREGEGELLNLFTIEVRTIGITGVKTTDIAGRYHRTSILGSPSEN